MAHPGNPTPPERRSSGEARIDLGRSDASGGLPASRRSARALACGFGDRGQGSGFRYQGPTPGGVVAYGYRDRFARTLREFGAVMLAAIGIAVIASHHVRFAGASAPLGSAVPLGYTGLLGYTGAMLLVAGLL